MKLNRFKVPFWSLLINFVLGMLIFLPFPSWSEIVGFISSAIIMSFAFGPVSLVALRHQAPEVNRPFRLPFGIAFSAISFVLIGFVVYWTGWETNWKVLLAVMAGLVLMVIVRMSGDGPKEPLNIKQSLWLWPYFVGLGVISYLGDYGHGRGVITQGFALIIITLFSLAIFLLASKLRFSREETRRLILAEK